MKWYRQSFDYVMYEISYENMILYGATIPSLDDEKKDNVNRNDKDNKNEVIRADDPANWGKMRSLFKNSK